MNLLQELSINKRERAEAVFIQSRMIAIHCLMPITLHSTTMFIPSNIPYLPIIRSYNERRYKGDPLVAIFNYDVTSHDVTTTSLSIDER